LLKALRKSAAQRRRLLLYAAATVALCLFTSSLRAQAAEDILSQKEVDTLRDTAFVPSDRIGAFTQFLNDRQKRIQELARRRGHTDYGGDMHDAIDQFGQIADELNDNLDEYARQHRDVRKVLPKLLKAVDEWTATLQAPTDNESYNVVRRIALDNVKDTREIAQQLQTDLDTYFKLHPEAEKAEKKRSSDPHAVRPE
jgi:exonuclease VII large subunit